MKRLIVLVSFVVLVISLSGLSFQKRIDEKPLYTIHNIWFENPQEVYAINFKRGVMIPAGTKVSIKPRLYSRASGSIPGQQALLAVAEIGGFGQLYFWRVIRWQPRLSKKIFKARTFSNFTFSELTTDLSKREIELIKKGEVDIGMSRKAVLISYGYPPLHRTPNLNNGFWYYWLSRSRQQMIVFDDNWKVSQITD